MSLSVTTIEDTLYAWLASVTGETVILAEENGTRPAPPFGTIKLTNITRVGTTEVKKPDANGDREAVNNYELAASFQFFGSSARQKALDVLDILGLETGTATLEAAGLYFFRSNGIPDLSELLRGDYEKRAGLDVVFGIQGTATEAVGLIETINMTGTVYDQAEDVAHTLSTTVSQ
jgi:hypothetical protein